MIYQCNFKDLNDDVYRVAISNSFGADPNDIVELELGTQPLITSFESGGETLYKPVKCSTSTLNLLVNDQYFDLYSQVPHENLVMVVKSDMTTYTDKVIWQGYVTPSAYNQAWDGDKTNLEVECIDCLASLKYIKYESEKRKQISFYNLIKNLIRKMGGVYRNLYVSYNFDIVKGNNQYESNLLQNLYISQENFFDEDDEPMNCKEILEQICQYLNVTCFVEGSDVWMIDYDELKAGNRAYKVYDLADDKMVDKTMEYPFRHITKVDFKSADNNISLDKVVNKVTVRDSFYAFDTIFPNLWDDKYLHSYPASGKRDIYEQAFKIDSSSKNFRAFFRYFRNDNCTTFSYDKNTLSPLGQNIEPTWNNLNNTITAALMEAQVSQNKSRSAQASRKNNLDMDKYLCIMNNNAPYKTQKEVYRMNVPVKKDSYLLKNTWLILKGSVMYQNTKGVPVPLEDLANKQENDIAVRDAMYLLCEIRYGNNWWQTDNAIDGKWVKAKTLAKVPLDTSSVKDAPKNYGPNRTEHFLNMYFPIINNISWAEGLEGEGYKIPVPSDIGPDDELSITFYNPHNPSLMNNDGDYERHLFSLWIKNFEVETQIQNWSSDYSDRKKSEDDTEYSNVVNEDFVEELGDIEYKVCTYDNKKPNYSTVLFYDAVSGTYTPLSQLKRKVNKSELISEQHMIDRIVGQYSTPSIVLDITIGSNIQGGGYLQRDITMKSVCVLDSIYGQGKKFIVDEMAIDYESDTKQLKLVEKK